MSQKVEISELNSSYTKLKFTETGDQIKQILKKTLSIERDGWMFDRAVKMGYKSKYDFFFEELKDNSILVCSGVLEVPAIRSILKLESSDLEQDQQDQQDQTDIDLFIDDILESNILPFDPYDYQLYAVRQALEKKRKLSLMCTGSGKSLTISLCLEYFRRRDMKGVLVVPNINLLTQFAKDIKSYNLEDLHQRIITFGGGSKSMQKLKDQQSQKLNKGDLVITTWQSLSKLKSEFFEDIDYIICDEVHRFSSQCTSKLVNDSINTKFKLGFTGTLPDQKTSKMTLIGLFGTPEMIISSNELILHGRGTPINVIGVLLQHSELDSQEINLYMEYLDKLKYMLSIDKRNKFIADLALDASRLDQGSTLVLFRMIEHGQQLYKQITGEEVSNLERMKELGVYFMSGSSSAKDREYIRNVMNEDSRAILVANYALLSTGVNIKSLRYAILASPVKSAVTVAQTLGRGIRTSEGKEVFEVFDIVDVFRGCRIFRNQYSSRKKVYEKSKFKLKERKEIL